MTEWAVGQVVVFAFHVNLCCMVLANPVSAVVITNTVQFFQVNRHRYSQFHFSLEQYWVCHQHNRMSSLKLRGFQVRRRKSCIAEHGCHLFDQLPGKKNVATLLFSRWWSDGTCHQPHTPDPRRFCVVGIKIIPSPLDPMIHRKLTSFILL